MNDFLIKWVSNGLALFLTTYIIKGIEVSGFGPALIAALLLGIVNAILKPVLVLLTLPLTIMSFGLFALIINGGLLILVSRLVSGFEVNGLFAAVIGSVVLSVFSWIINGLIGR